MAVEGKGHNWEDVAYHGSPTWQCKYCGCYESSKEAEEACPKAEECKKKEKEAKEKEERWEYRQLLKAKKRFEYLQDKYGEIEE